MKVLYLLPLIGLIHANKGKFSCCGVDAAYGNRYSGLILPMVYNLVTDEQCECITFHRIAGAFVI